MAVAPDRIQACDERAKERGHGLPFALPSSGYRADRRKNFDTRSINRTGIPPRCIKSRVP